MSYAAKAVARSERDPGKKARVRRTPTGGATSYPRHDVQKALRIPRAILEQNAGRPCTDREAAAFAGVGYHGPFQSELSSAIKYGWLSHVDPGRVIRLLGDHRWMCFVSTLPCH